MSSSKWGPFCLSFNVLTSPCFPWGKKYSTYWSPKSKCIWKLQICVYSLISHGPQWVEVDVKCFHMSNHCSLVMPYGDIDLSQYWFRQIITLQCQTITRANIKLLSNGPLRTHFSEIQIKMNIFCQKMQLNMLSAKCWPFCSGLNVLTN